MSKIDNDIWMPKDDEYTPGLTKDDWVSLLNDPAVFNSECLKAMACIYDCNGEGSCLGLAKKYNQNMVLWRTVCGVHLAGRIAEKTGCQINKVNDKPEYFTILFKYRKTTKEETGSWIYKLRKELYEALTEINILRFLPVHIEEFAKYEKGDFLKDVFMSEDNYDSLVALLKNKKNVILQGAPGVGKTFPRVILQYLYLLSEAAPTIVMAFLQNDRKDDKGIVLSSFYDNGISSNDYCNVLSAIEELALHEETRVSACDFLFDLCKQTRDIQFIFSNTPRESLMKILCLWNNYTTFTVNDKLTLIKKYLTADEIFTIPFAIELIFKDHITHGVRNGRDSVPNTTVLYEDLFEAINELGAFLFRKSVENHYIENILKLFDGYSHFHIDTLTEASKMFDAKDYSNEELVHLNTKLREKAFYANANDAMKPWIPALSEWITVTTPHDDIARVGWLFFDYHHCCIPEILESDDWENKQKTIEKKREETLNTLISEHTLEQVKCLLKYTGDDSSFGEFFAKRLPTELLLTFADEAHRLGKKSLLYGLINNSDYNNCVRILDSLSPDEQITSLEYLNRRDIIDWIDTPEKEKSYWSHQRMIEYNDEVFQKMMKYNPTELLSFYAYFSKGMLSVSIEKIIDVFTAILALPSIKSNGRYVHEFDRILSRLDKEGYYSTELASLCASLYTEYYEMNPHSVYPNILKRYYFENPSIICDKLLRKDRDAYSHFMFYYVLPDDAYSNPDSLAFFVNTFITRHTDKDILLSALGSILGKAKDGSDGIFPHDLVRSELEKYRALRLNHEVYIGKLNSRGAHLVSDGMSLKSLAQKLASDAKKVDVMYPETAQLLRWYSDHLLAEGDHDLLYSEIGSSMF